MSIVSTVEFLKKYNNGYLRPMAVCADGFCLSIQASEMHYCSPRVNLASCEYTKVELGCLSDEEEELLPYAENESWPQFTIYGFVPVDVVDAVLKKHGGIKE